MSWYNIHNIDTIDTPALVIYPDRVQHNILQAIRKIKDISLLRPHVKTNKISEVCEMMIKAGITAFKCATIAEAEMLAMLAAKDVLLAYQPVGPKVERLGSLVKQYPHTKFSCLLDNAAAAEKLSAALESQYLSIQVFMDINAGMNRTGIAPSKATSLLHEIMKYPALHFAGLHAYDGHIVNADGAVRRQQALQIVDMVQNIASEIEHKIHQPVIIIMGGSVTFSVYRNLPVECSPGTFVFWDWSYENLMPEENFLYAALVVTRVISIVDDKTITIDLGHKSVAAENPLPRVYFLNAPGLQPIGQSEEHMVLRITDNTTYSIGDILYAVPVHICPTVALYGKAIVIQENKAITNWKVIAREREINI